MAHPFGGIPTFAALRDCLTTLGCIVAKGQDSFYGPDGPATIWVLHNKANNRWVSIPDMPDDERVMPTMIEYIERRLGLATGYATLKN